MNGARFISLGIVVAIASLANAAPSSTTAPVTLESRAKEITAMFKPKAGGFDAVFAPSFLAAVPAAQLSTLLGQLHAQLGACTGATITKKTTPEAGEFEFAFEKGFTAAVQLSIDPAPPHKVTGFYIGPPTPAVKSLDDLAEQFKKLPGTASLFVASINGKDLTPIAKVNEDQPLAIGSSFKLYVLAELVRQIKAGERHWIDVIPLDAKAQSLPSGFLRDWPAGSPITVHTLAGLMISQSDNTATDQMIRTLGREKIEHMVATAGNTSASKNVPFLTTQEMFKLKGDATGKLAKDFLAADAPGRRKLLDGAVAAMPLSAVSLSPNPSHIDEIEWFASTADLARVMRHLVTETASGDAQQARAILAINPGIPATKDKWKYVGFKGGSEIGVMNLTLLLESSKDKWFVISATQNDPQHAIDEAGFVGIVQRAAMLLAQQQSSR